jgi:RNA polymerase sigma-70 factor (ECF subfamily)
MTDNIIPFRRRAGHVEADDDALVAATAAGDNGALEELFKRHGDRIHRILVRLRAIDRRDLEDIVQNTFLELRKAARGFDRRAAVGTWIVGIAMNLARHHVRGESRRRTAMALVASTPPGAEVRRPDERVAQSQMFARLQAEFDRLPAGLRIVFTLCDLEGMRGVDVGRALGIPEGTVWRRLHEARSRLRAALDEAEGAP